jgi:hypothetical protein
MLPLIPNFVTDEIARELEEAEKELSDATTGVLTENIELSLLKASGCPAEALKTLYQVGETVDLRQLLPVSGSVNPCAFKDDYEG